MEVSIMCGRCMWDHGGDPSRMYLLFLLLRMALLAARLASIIRSKSHCCSTVAPAFDLRKSRNLGLMVFKLLYLYST